MIKQCVICGKEFEAATSQYKYCSPQCRRKANYVPAEVKLRNCIFCGKEFETRSGKKNTCSIECKKKIANKRTVLYQKRKREEMKAMGVKQTRKKKDSDTKEKRKWVQPVFKPRVCVKCGKEYIPCNSAQKYCSPVCRCPNLAKKLYKEPKPLKGLALENHLAREQGLTYGQWRGLQILKELKGK